MAVMRLLARTEAMPAWDEGCERAAKKTPEVERVVHVHQRCLKQPHIVHPSVRNSVVVQSTAAYDPQTQKIARDASRGTPALIDPHIASCQTHECATAYADRRRSAGEPASSRRAHRRDETRRNRGPRAGLAKKTHNTLDRT